MRNVRQIAVLIAFVLAISARVSTAAPDFYANLLRRGIGEFNAGRYASASTLLRTAAFGLLDAIDQFETAQTYIAVASQRLGRDDDARQATRRIIQAERIQRRFATLPLPPELRSEFESLAARYLTGAEHAALNDAKAAVPPRQVDSAVTRRTIETPRQQPEPVPPTPTAPPVTAAAPKTAPAPSAPAETAQQAQQPAKTPEVARPTAEAKPQPPAAKPAAPATSAPVPSVAASTPAPDRTPQPKTTEPPAQVPATPTEAPKREAVPAPAKAAEPTPEPVTKKAEVAPAPAKPEPKVEVYTVPVAPEKAQVEATPQPPAKAQKPAVEPEQPPVAKPPAPKPSQPTIEAKPAPAEKREPQSVPPPVAKPAPAPAADAVREAQREFERKVAEVERAERKPAAKPAPPRDVTKALQEATATLDKGDVYGSRAQLRAIFDTPNLARADVLRIAEEAYRAQDFRLSAEAFDRVGALGKGEEALGYYLAVALYETGRYEAAKAALNAALPYIEVTEAVARYRAKIEGAADSARDKHSLP